MASDTLQKMKSSFNRGVATISVKTASSLEKVKIKTHIDSLTSEINRLMTSAGETAYVMWEEQKTDTAELEAIFASIQQKRQEISQLREQYQAIGERESQILGSTVDVQAKEEDTLIICPNCQQQYTVPVKFCRNCGQKLV